MNLSELIIRDDALTESFDAKRALLEWVGGAIGFADDFPLDKHTPEAFFETYCKINPNPHASLSVTDVKRAFALFMLSQESESFAIPDEWMVYDDVTFLMKELWY